MKKAYVKPEIMFESFRMNAKIAADCFRTGYVTTAEPTTCEYKANGGETMVIFVSINTDCHYKQDDDSSYCYAVPSDETRIFDS